MTRSLLAAPLVLGYARQVAERAGAASDSVRTDAGLSGLAGLLADETLTRLGQEFYDEFYARWRPPPGAVNFIVRVQEQPLPSLGTQVSVVANDEVVFQSRLQPDLDFILEAARVAVVLTSRAIQRPRAGLPGI